MLLDGADEPKRPRRDQVLPEYAGRQPAQDPRDDLVDQRHVKVELGPDGHGFVDRSRFHGRLSPHA
jgi:hypothetical protein